MLHVFLIWENGRKQEDKIINDIASKYDIKQVFSVNWPKAEFANNLSRFYGKRLPTGCKKEKECGTGEFTLILCVDNNPIMVDHAHHPNEKSNKHPLQDKYTYRQWTGGGYLVHASDNFNETNDNLLILLGKTADECLQEYSQSWNGKRIAISGSIIGANGWENETELKKIVSKLPNISISNGANREIIIFTPDFAYTSRILNLKKRFQLFKKNQYMAVVNGRNRNILLKQAN